MIKKLAIFLLILAGLVMTLLVSNSCGEKVGQENNSFLELLKLLPATAKDAGGFVLIDYKLVFRESGISLYSPNGQKISREDFSKIITDKTAEGHEDELIPFELGSYYTGYGPYTLVSTIQDGYVGYNFTDIDAEIDNLYLTFGSSFQDEFKFEKDIKVAAIGEFDPEATKSALSNQDSWPAWATDNYSSENYRGITIHSWSNGGEVHFDSAFSPPHMDIMGRAFPLAVTDKNLFLASSTEDVKSMIDSSQKKVSTLADVSEYALAAQGMSDLNASMAIIADESLVNGYPTNYEHDKGPFLKKFLTFGTGYGRDEKGNYIALVLVNDSSENAKENVSLLEQRITTTESYYYEKYWKDLIYETQIQAKGRVLMAKLYTNNTKLWINWFVSQDILVLHEK